MNVNVKTMWVKALKSGTYKSAQHEDEKSGAMRSKTNLFCPLGVLCDLHRKASKKKGWVLDGDGYSYLGWSTVLPEPVLKWAGLPVDMEGDAFLVGIMYKGRKTNVAALFDQDDLSFAQIAELINRKL